MKQLIGFIPNKSTNELHLRVKNLTGNVVEITNNTVKVDFFITVDEKVEVLRVDYPLNQCDDFFVGNPIRKNEVTFHEFCNSLMGFDVYLRNNLVSRWELFFSGYTSQYILSAESNFRIDAKPKPYSFLEN